MSRLSYVCVRVIEQRWIEFRPETGTLWHGECSVPNGYRIGHEILVPAIVAVTNGPHDVEVQNRRREVGVRQVEDWPAGVVGGGRREGGWLPPSLQWLSPR